MTPDPGKFVMPFGKHADKTLDKIAGTDEGLLYLDWAAGEIQGRVGDAIRAYVNQDAIARDIQTLMKE